MTMKIITDPVARDSAGAREIGFRAPETYNASELLFRNRTPERRDRIAILGPDGAVTYEDLCALACRTCAGLGGLGLQRGDRVMLFLNDTSAYPSIMFGAIRAGLVPVLINTSSPADLIRYYLQDSAARAVFTDAEHSHLFNAQTLMHTGVETIVTVGASAQAPIPGIEVLSWSEWIEKYPEDAGEADTARDDMAFWMYSSGSTGKPKGIVHLQHDLLYTAESYGRHILNITAGDRCFSVPKIFFAYGLGNSIAFPFSVGASSILYPGRPQPEQIFETIRKFKPTIFFGLPTLYNALMQVGDSVGRGDLESVRLCISAAEVLPPELGDAWRERFGRRIIEGLGSSEMTHIYLSNRPGDAKPRAAGKRVPGYEIKLTDRDGRIVKQGEEGILWIRADSSSPCYWNLPGKTDEAMRGDWVWSGDRFVEDEDGFFYFQGRADDLVKISGQWVYPLEVELCLADHPGVLECAVMALELPDGRMTLKAFVAPNDNPVNEEKFTAELQNFVKQALLPYKYPRIIEYLSELPKTGTAKIDRQALRNRDQSGQPASGMEERAHAETS